MSEKKAIKRGPVKKVGFRQDLRITPEVEQAFKLIKEKFSLRYNSEALHVIAEIFLKNYHKK
jgi:hypothetical protein